jgi:hypothetical protein
MRLSDIPEIQGNQSTSVPEISHDPNTDDFATSMKTGRNGNQPFPLQAEPDDNSDFHGSVASDKTTSPHGGDLQDFHDEVAPEAPNICHQELQGNQSTSVPEISHDPNTDDFATSMKTGRNGNQPFPLQAEPDDNSDFHGSVASDKATSPHGGDFQDFHYEVAPEAPNMCHQELRIGGGDLVTPSTLNRPMTTEKIDFPPISPHGNGGQSDGPVDEAETNLAVDSPPESVSGRNPAALLSDDPAHVPFDHAMPVSLEGLVNNASGGAMRRRSDHHKRSPNRQADKEAKKEKKVEKNAQKLTMKVAKEAQRNAKKSKDLPVETRYGSLPSDRCTGTPFAQMPPRGEIAASSLPESTVAIESSDEPLVEQSTMKPTISKLVSFEDKTGLLDKTPTKPTSNNGHGKVYVPVGLSRLHLVELPDLVVSFQTPYNQMF